MFQMVGGDSYQCMKRTEQSTVCHISVRLETYTVSGCGFVTRYQNTSNLETKESSPMMKTHTGNTMFCLICEYWISSLCLIIQGLDNQDQEVNNQINQYPKKNLIVNLDSEGGENWQESQDTKKTNPSPTYMYSLYLSIYLLFIIIKNLAPTVSWWTILNSKCVLYTQSEQANFLSTQESVYPPTISDGGKS